MKEIEDLQMFVASVRRMTAMQRMANAGKIADDAIEKVTAVVEGIDRRLSMLEIAQSATVSVASMLLTHDRRIKGVAHAVAELAGTGTRKADQVLSILVGCE